MPLIAATLDRDNPRQWYYALMDYGSMLKQLHPNPGKRSKQYSLQSRFEGSNRQLRSRLLRQIIAQPGITAQQLLALTAARQEIVLGNLEAMQREGFLIRKGRGYRVCDESTQGTT